MIQFYFLSNRMARVASRFVVVMMVLFASLDLAAQKTATVSGNWSNPATWTPSGVPAASDAVIINPGITVTVDVNNAQAANLTLNVSGVGAQTSTLLFNNGSQLTVTGTFTFGQVVDRPGVINMSAGGTLSVGNFAVVTTSGSSFTAGSGTLIITGTSTLPDVFASLNNLTVATTGNLTLASNITVANTLTTNGTLNVGTYTINLGDDWFNTGTFAAGTGNVNFSGTAQQEMPGVTFNDLTISNTSGLVVANGNITVNGTFSSASTLSLLDMKTYMFSMPVSGTVNNNGTIRTQNTSSTPLPLNKTWGAAGNGTVLYNAPAGGQTIVTGTYNNLQADHSSGGTSTANGDIIIGGTIAALSANTVINLATYQLTHQLVGGIGGGNNVGTIRTQNTSLLPLPAGRTWGGTILYDAPTGGQKIVFGTYNNLSVTGSGTEDVAASIVVNGVLSTAAGTVINMNQETITGTFTATNNNGTIRTQAQTGAFTAGKTWGGTIVYDATSTSNGAQTIIDGNYNNLTISLDRGSNNNVTLPATLNVAGNLVLSATLNGTGQFTGGSTFNFNGTNQSISVTATTGSGAYAFNNVTIAGGGTKTLANAVTMNGLLTLTSGVLQTSSTNLLTLSSTATVSAPSAGDNSSYVSGPLRRMGTTAFTFPVGKSGVYAPVSIGAPGTGGDFTAEYFRPQTLGTAVTAPLVRVSPCEYWNVAKNAGASDPAITLSWGSSSNCGSGQYVTDLSSLAVAQWNGSSWINAGTSATSGTASQGTVTSNAATLAAPYGAVTLAATNGTQNPLPVRLTTLTAVKTAAGVQLNWQVMNEADVVSYTVERSANGNTFTALVSQSPSLNNGSIAAYNYLDQSATGTVYYRIRSVDKDGSVSYSMIAKLNLAVANSRLEVYPNPATGDRITLALSGLEKGKYQISLVDLSGRIVLHQQVNVDGGSYTGTLQLPSAIATGIYNLKVSGSTTSLTERIVIR